MKKLFFKLPSWWKVVISHESVYHSLFTEKGNFDHPNTEKCSLQFVSTFNRMGITGAISDSNRKISVLLLAFCFTTGTPRNDKVSSLSLSMIGFIGPAVICTKSISSEYLSQLVIIFLIQSKILSLICHLSTL